MLCDSPSSVLSISDFERTFYSMLSTDREREKKGGVKDSLSISVDKRLFDARPEPRANSPTNKVG